MLTSFKYGFVYDVARCRVTSKEAFFVVFDSTVGTCYGTNLGIKTYSLNNTYTVFDDLKLPLPPMALCEPRIGSR